MNHLMNAHHTVISQTVFVGIILVLVLLWVYWPGLNAAYDYHDAFYMYTSSDKSCSLHPQWAYFNYLGRPLYALMTCLTTIGVSDTLQYSIIVRVIAFFILALSALWIYFLIRSIGYTTTVSVVIAIGIVTLPGIQLFVHLTQTVPILLSIPLVLLAANLFAKWEDRFLSIFDGGKNFFGPILPISMISLILIICSLIYQQLSSLFFLFICLLCLSPKHPASLKRMFLLLGFGVIAYGIHGLIYLVLHNQFILPYALSLMGKTLSQMQGQPYDVAVSLDFLGKIQFLFTGLLQKGLRLWSIDYSHPITQVTVWLLPATILAWCISATKQIAETRQALIIGLGSLAVIFLSLILVNVPNLMAAHASSIAGRHVIAFQGLIIAIICIGITQIPINRLNVKSANTLLVCIIFAFISTGVMQARQNFDLNMAGLAQKEIAYIRNALAPAMPELPKRIVVIQPHVTSLALADGLTDIQDENGRLTTMYPQDVPWILLAVFLDLGGQRDQFPPVEVIGCCSSVPASSPDDLVIDMRIFAQNMLQRRIGFHGEYSPTK